MKYPQVPLRNTSWAGELTGFLTVDTSLSREGGTGIDGVQMPWSPPEEK